MKQQRTLILTAALMLAAAAGITAAGIVFKQDLWRMLPLYVSLAVALLQSRVSRLAPLLGGINSILYALVYFSYQLYASAIYALAVSMTLQIITFIRWSKRPAGNSTVLRTLSAGKRIGIVIGFGAAWLILNTVTGDRTSEYFLLDNTVTLVGIFSSILMMLSYLEFTWILILSNLVSLTLYTAMLPKNPEQLTYLVFSIYSLICAILAARTALKNYRLQQHDPTVQHKPEHI